MFHFKDFDLNNSVLVLWLKLIQFNAYGVDLCKLYKYMFINVYLSLFKHFNVPRLNQNRRRIIFARSVTFNSIDLTHSPVPITMELEGEITFPCWLPSINRSPRLRNLSRTSQVYAPRRRCTTMSQVISKHSSTPSWIQPTLRVYLKIHTPPGNYSNSDRPSSDDQKVSVFGNVINTFTAQ